MKNETKGLLPILSITGSDGTGGSGIQADIKTCGVLGGYALSVVTAVTVQDTRGIRSTHPMNAEVVEAQLCSVVSDMSPQAVKIGMLCDVDAVVRVSQHLRDLTHVVLDTAFISSRGERIATEDVVNSICSRIMPHCDIVIMKASEAEMLLGTHIYNKKMMLVAAKTLLRRYGMEAIIIQGTHHTEEMSNDLFVFSSSADNAVPEGDAVTHSFFTLPDHANCNTHGLAGTLSASIATYLARRESLSRAVELAYSYLQTLTVYFVKPSHSGAAPSSLIGHSISSATSPRQRELYNQFMQLVANNMHRQHDVLFYANSLNITPRYLAQITMPISGKTPKQLLTEAIIDEAVTLLTTTTRSIQQISFDLGFPNQIQLAKMFKRVKGMPPSGYRKK